MDAATYEKAATLRGSIIELGAWISIWRDDVAGNLKPTPTSIEHATAVYERALAECDAVRDAALESRQTKETSDAR
jgi:hypothetical protein